MAPQTSKTTTLQTTDLEELIDVLAVLGVSVRSPHQRMIDEAAAPAAQGEDGDVKAEAEAEAAAAEAEAAAAEAEAEALAIAVAVAEAEAEAEAAAAAAQAEAAAVATAAAQALSSTANPLTRDLVVQALRALGIDVGEVASPPAAAANQPAQAGSSTGPDTQHSDKGKEVAQAPAPALPGICCAKCRHWNALPSVTTPSVTLANAFYVVTVGRDVGIFTDWHLTSSLVTGVSGAIFKKYNTRKEAENKFNEALSQGRVRRV